MSLPDPPPNPSTYRGVRLRTFLEDLCRWLRRDRIIAGVGVAIESTPAGRKISAGAGASGSSTGMALARLPSGGIASGATGTVTLYTAWNTVGSTTITVRNPWATAAPSMVKCVVGRVAGVDEIAVIQWDCA